MSLGNSPTSYGSLSKTFHWLTALLVLTVIPLGLIANDLAHQIRAPGATPDQDQIARATFLFSLHKTIGIAIFLTALARILWALGQPRPGLLNAERKLEALLAHTVHWLLYGSLLLAPLTGWIHHAATTGFAPIWWPFGQSLPFVPKNEILAARFAGLHEVLVKVMGASILLHVVGALKHHLIDRDDTLRRMWPGRAVQAVPSATHAPATAPAFLALAIWAGALGIGAAFGAYAPPKTAQPAPQLQAVASDWQVESGSIGLTVTQLGSAVAGGFSDWTAAIRFDPTVTEGPAGDVSVTVAIASLSLGSVTGQALGADYFDAQSFPTATFQATITRLADGLVATGPLTIRGQSIETSLPFDLTLTGDTASMTGSLRLNRMEFGIGTSVPDEATLGFTVDVSVALTATRAPAN